MKKLSDKVLQIDHTESFFETLDNEIEISITEIIKEANIRMRLNPVSAATLENILKEYL